MNKLFKYMALLGLLAIAACDSTLIDPPRTDRGDLDASSYVAIGGTETSGFADGALYNTALENSYPALIARQIRTTGSITFLQPTVGGDSGVAIENGQFVARLKMGFNIDCSGDTLLIPVRQPYPNVSGFFLNSSTAFNNQGIPGLKADDLDNGNLANENIYFSRQKATNTTTPLENIQLADPSFFTLWLGTQEVLNYAMNGGEQPLADVSTFRQSLTSLLDTLAKDSTRAGMIATVPDIMDFPFFNTITYNYLTLDNDLAALLNSVYQPRFTFAAGPNPFVVSDAAAADGRRLAIPTDKMVLTIPVDSIKCQFLGSINPLPGRYYLNGDEVATARSYVVQLNSVIRELAATYGLTLVDLNAMYAKLNTGLLSNGVEYTNVLVTGNFFSLDGLNPSLQGHALIANQFIEAINERFFASIPLLEPTAFDGPQFP